MYRANLSRHARRRNRILKAEELERRWVLSAPNIVEVSPPTNSHSAPADSEIAITFDEAIAPESVSSETLVIHAMQTGQLLVPTGALRVEGNIVAIDPPAPLLAGESVQVTATTGIRTLEGDSPEAPEVWQFQAGVNPSTGVFTEGQNFQTSAVSAALGDVDGDADLDVFLGAGFHGGFATAGRPNHILINDGTGTLVDSGQQLGDTYSRSVALGDLDRDGDLDAFVGNLMEDDVGRYGEPDAIWMNDGNGSFHDSGQTLGQGNTNDVGLADVDGDGDLDALVATSGVVFPGREEPNTLWINDGQGRFEAVSQPLGVEQSYAVAFGDLDADGDLDAVFGNGGWTARPNTIWWNDGSGAFEDSGQRLGNDGTLDVALGDLDNDGDLDALFANSQNEAEVWLNDGQGGLQYNGQNLNVPGSTSVALGDLDGDGNLDALLSTGTGDADAIWRGDGHGNFVASRQSLSTQGGTSVVLGDMDTDGDLDVLVDYGAGDMGDDSDSQVVWLNDQTTLGLIPGDANRDGRFDQEDILQILQAAKYLTGEPATWEEGDWNGDGVFDQQDIVAAMQTGAYGSDVTVCSDNGTCGDDEY